MALIGLKEKEDFFLLLMCENKIKETPMGEIPHSEHSISPKQK